MRDEPGRTPSAFDPLNAGDQVVAAVDLGVAFERNSQGSDVPNQVRGRRSVWRMEGDADCPPDSRPALLEEIGEESYAVGIRSRDQQAYSNSRHTGHPGQKYICPSGPSWPKPNRLGISLKKR